MVIVHPRVPNLGAAIRQARRDRGWTQAELAGRAGVSRALLIAVERGDRPGAELSGVLALLRALELVIDLVPDTAPSFDEAMARLLEAEP